MPIRRYASWGRGETCWPASSILGVLGNGGIITVPLWPARYSGTKGHKRISGIAKDSTSAAVVGATCKAYRTSADVNNSLAADLQEGPASVSASDGSYECMVPNSDQHYVVSYKSGTPDVAGVTVNTLVGV